MNAPRWTDVGKPGIFGEGTMGPSLGDQDAREQRSGAVAGNLPLNPQLAQAIATRRLSLGNTARTLQTLLEKLAPAEGPRAAEPGPPKPLPELEEPASGSSPFLPEVVLENNRSYWAHTHTTHVANERYYKDCRKKLKYILEKYFDHSKFAVDVGCGNGEYTFEICGFFDQVHAFDINENMIRSASEMAQERKLNIEFHCVDLTRTKMDFTQKICAVFCMGVFVCLPEDRVIEEMLLSFKALLKAGGILVLRESLLDEKPNFVRQHGYVAHYRSRREFLNMLKRCGFCLLEEIELLRDNSYGNSYFVLSSDSLMTATIGR